MLLEKQTLSLLADALDQMASGFHLEAPCQLPESDMQAMKQVLLQTATRMQDNYPYFHPLYAGQMLKPPHPIARAAYALAMWINPNNHALDGGRASSEMEKEAVANLAAMFGWETHLGHLCSGGTMANLEALWVAGQTQPDKLIVASSQAHYTHHRICGVLKLPFQSVGCDDRARMDLSELAAVLDQGNVGTVVVTLGTTATGSVDPLADILKLKSEYGFRIHVDAAYGGFFTLVSNLANDTQRAFDALSQVDSIVVDPHKHGLQPYGCGCVLFADPSVGRFYKHDSPYTYFSSDALHLGEISLECSRPGASAVALWATQQLLPLVRGGQFAASLEQCRQAALALYEKLASDTRFLIGFVPELDIVIWAPKADTASRISDRSQKFFQLAAEKDLHLAVAKFPASLFASHWPHVIWDQDEVACLRSCLMKPEHLAWNQRIWEIIDQAQQALDSGT